MPRESENRDQWEANRLQRRRKEGRNFPMDLLRRGLDFCVQKARATRDLDRRRILNYIAGRLENLDDEPPAEHPKYDEVPEDLAAEQLAEEITSARNSEQDIKPKFSSELLFFIGRKMK